MYNIGLNLNMMNHVCIKSQLRREELRRIGKANPGMRMSDAVLSNNTNLIQQEALKETSYYYEKGLVVEQKTH